MSEEDGMSEASAPARVVVEYVCARREHVLARVTAEANGELVLHAVHEPVYGQGSAPGKVSTRAYPGGSYPLSQLAFGAVGLSCGCNVDVILTGPSISRDVAERTERVVLDATR